MHRLLSVSESLRHSSQIESDSDSENETDAGSASVSTDVSLELVKKHLNGTLTAQEREVLSSKEDMRQLSEKDLSDDMSIKSEGSCNL